MGNTNKRKLYVEPAAYIGAAVFLLMIPLRWVLAWFLAATVHEVFHCLALLICGREIYEIRVGLKRTIIEAVSGTECQTVFCSFAGPFGGILLLAFYSIYPQLAICAFIQTAFNLLPICPLDGGQILCALAAMMFSNSVARGICFVFKVLVLMLVSACCIAASIVLHTCFFLLIPVVLFLQIARE